MQWKAVLRAKFMALNGKEERKKSTSSKMREEINEIKNRKTIEKINKT